MSALRRPVVLVVSITLALLAAACSTSSSSTATTGTTEPGSTTGASIPAGTITVAAASSLTEAFTRIGADFEAANPGTKVQLTFDSSSTLVKQLGEGAPIDVLATADESSMKKAIDAGTVGAPTIFATNDLAIVTKPGNPLGITGLADLTKAATVSLCVDTAPCGALAAKAFTSAGVTVDESKVSRGQNVKATLTAVTEGDADVAIVYVTDARRAAAKVATVTIPPTQNQQTRYPIAPAARSPQQALAAAFVAFVAGPRGQGVLRDAGFGAP